MIIYLCGLILDTLYYWAVKFIDLSSDRLLLDSFGWPAKSSLHIKKEEQTCGRYPTFLTQCTTETTIFMQHSKYTVLPKFIW